MVLILLVECVVHNLYVLKQIGIIDGEWKDQSLSYISITEEGGLEALAQHNSSYIKDRAQVTLKNKAKTSHDSSQEQVKSNSRSRLTAPD